MTSLEEKISETANAEADHVLTITVRHWLVWSTSHKIKKICNSKKQIACYVNKKR